MKSRRQRRQESRDSGVPFEPQYTTGERIQKIGKQSKKIAVGGAPKSYEETYGVGYERYDDKFTKVSELIGK